METIQRQLTLSVASTSEAKLDAVREAVTMIDLGRKSRIIGVPVSIPVSQPLSDSQTLVSAEERLRQLRLERPMSDIWVAIEAGIEVVRGHSMVIAWVIAADNQRQGYSRSASVEIPTTVAEWASREGQELGSVLRRVGYGTSTSTVSLVEVVTAGHVTRQQLYVHPTVLALSRLLPPWEALASAAAMENTHRPTGPAQKG